MPLRHVGPGGEGLALYQRRVARISGAVHRGGGPALLADIFHDVGLAAVGPVTVAEQPESGPEPRAIRHPDARRDLAVGERILARGVDPARYEIDLAPGGGGEAGTVLRTQDQRPTPHTGGCGKGDGFGRIDIGLLLVVHPHRGTSHVPFGAVEAGGVELLGESELGSRCRCGWRRGRNRRGSRASHRSAVARHRRENDRHAQAAACEPGCHRGFLASRAFWQSF